MVIEWVGHKHCFYKHVRHRHHTEVRIFSHIYQTLHCHLLEIPSLKRGHVIYYSNVIIYESLAPNLESPSITSMNVSFGSS